MTSKHQDAATPFTGCCSSLSADSPCVDAHNVDADSLDDRETLSFACFDCNEDYTSTTSHATISADEVRRCMNDYHGLCLSDDQLEGFIVSQLAAESSLEQLIAG